MSSLKCSPLWTISPPSLEVGSLTEAIQWQNSDHLGCEGVWWEDRIGGIARAVYVLSALVRIPSSAHPYVRCKAEPITHIVSLGSVRVGHDDKRVLSVEVVGDAVLLREGEDLDARLALGVDGGHEIAKRGLLAAREEASLELDFGGELWDDIVEDLVLLEAGGGRRGQRRWTWTGAGREQAEWWQCQSVSHLSISLSTSIASVFFYSSCSTHCLTTSSFFVATPRLAPPPLIDIFATGLRRRWERFVRCGARRRR